MLVIFRVCVSHLYYTDWGAAPAVVRVNLDGSDVEVLRAGLDSPNSVVVINGDVYYIDSYHKTGAAGALYRRDQSTENWEHVTELEV